MATRDGKEKGKKKLQPPQKQAQPGKESRMRPKPASEGRDYKAAGKLQDRVAIITGLPSHMDQLQA